MQPVQGQGQILSAEARRRLAPVSFASNTLAVSDLPRDTVLKRIDHTVVGTWSVTYASGTPVADAAGTASRLCPRLDVVIDGQRQVKSIDIWMQQRFNLLLAGQLPMRASATSASAFTTRIASTEVEYGAPYTWPATTQYVLVNEAFSVYFEQPFGRDKGDVSSLLNLKGVSSAELRYNFASHDNIQEAQSSLPSVTYGAVDVSFVATLIEAQEIPSSEQFLDFKESIRRFTFTGEVRDSLVDLPRGNALCGLGIMVRDGNATKSLSDYSVTDLSLLINGQRIIQRTKFLELQASNRMRFGAKSPRTSSKHALQGFAFMNLIKQGDLRSAIATTQAAGVDQIQLAITTAASSGNDAATYTNPVEVTVWTQELAATPARS